MRSSLTLAVAVSLLATACAPPTVEGAASPSANAPPSAPSPMLGKPVSFNLPSDTGDLTPERLLVPRDPAGLPTR